jgi:two-component system invasion response regulator UvrY
VIRVLIVDDHPVVRQGIRQIVESTDDIVVGGEATTGHEVADLLARMPCDLVLLDLSLPDVDGLDLLKRLCDQPKEVPVLVLTIHSEEQFAIRCLKAGAGGYLTKEAASSELVIAIRKIVSGGRYIPSPLAERLAAYLGPDGEKPPHERLSDREYQVLRLIAMGKSTRQIAADLTLSAKTVSTYRTRVLEKMRLTSTAELVSYALRHRLIK